MEDNRSLLKAAGLRCTAKRLAILELLGSAASPVAVEEVHDALMETGVRLDLSTVYRSLETMEAAGLVSRQRLGPEGRMFFERSGLGHRHFLRCTSCGVLVPLSCCPLEAYQETVESESSWVVLGHRLELFGYCPACREEKAGA